MGLHVNSVSDLPLSESRAYYIYVLDYYSWDEPVSNALQANVSKIASFCAAVKPEGTTAIAVSFGDAGGYYASATVGSFSEAVRWANALAAKAIAQNRELLAEFTSGALPWPESDEMHLPGIGKVKKP